MAEVAALQDHPMEVGPLSRMLVAYASGHPEVKAAVDGVLAQAQRAGDRAVLDPGPHCGAGNRSESDGGTGQQVGGRAGRQAGTRRPAHSQRREVGPRHLAERGAGMGFP